MTTEIDSFTPPPSHLISELISQQEAAQHQDNVTSHTQSHTQAQMTSLHLAEHEQILLVTLFLKPDASLV